MSTRKTPVFLLSKRQNVYTGTRLMGVDHTEGLNRIIIVNYSSSPNTKNVRVCTQYTKIHFN